MLAYKGFSVACLQCLLVFNAEMLVFFEQFTLKIRDIEKTGKDGVLLSRFIFQWLSDGMFFCEKTHFSQIYRLFGSDLESLSTWNLLRLVFYFLMLGKKWDKKL